MEMAINKPLGLELTYYMSYFKLTAVLVAASL